MRPLRLEVEGFTCYRDRQPVLDFAELTLFAIAGPTGAGKSSILDTMLYALFGKVPRIGKQGIAEFISHQRDVMTVALDFRVRGRDYRVTRLTKRQKSGLKSEATLADISGGLERSIADQIQPVNQAVEDLLGLGYEEFIQTVVLPQGEFAKFLKAKPADQRSILQHLLRHDVFTRMRDLAEDRRREMDAELRGLDGRLSALANATDEALTASELTLEHARERQASAATARDDADQEVQDARRRRKLTQDVEHHRRQRASLERDTPNIDGLRVELEQARRASAIVPRLEAFRAATSKVETSRQVHTNAGAAAQRATTAKRQATDRAAIASEAAKECDALSARLQSLHEIAGDVARRAQLTTDLKTVGTHVSSAEESLKAARDAQAQAHQKVRDLEARVRELQVALEDSNIDDALLDTIEAASASAGAARVIQEHVASLQADLVRSETEQAAAEQKAAGALRARDKAQYELSAAEEELARVGARVRQLQDALDDCSTDDAMLKAVEGSMASVGTARAIQQDITSLEDELIRCRAEQSDAEQRSAQALAARDKAQSILDAAEEALAAARAALDAGRDRDRAATLRAHLHAGDACPVCLQVVTQVPPEAAGTELLSLEKELAEAKSQAATAASARHKAHTVLATAIAASKQAAKTVEARGTKLTERRGALNALLSALSAIVPVGTSVDGSAILAWIEESRETLRAARVERERREKDVRGAEVALSAARLVVAEAQGVAKRALDLHQRHLDEQTRLESAAAAARIKLTERRDALNALLSTLSALVPVGTTVDGPAILTWMDERRESLRAAKAERERRAKSVQDAETALNTARLSVAEAEGAAKRAADHHERQLDERARIQADLEAAVARIQAVSTHVDPLAERDALARRIADLQDDDRNAAKALTVATNAAIKADTELEAAQSTLSDATAHASATEVSLTQALTDAGFTGVDAVVASVRSEGQQKTLQARVAEFDEQCAGVLQRLADLEPQVAGKEMSADRLDEIERQTKTTAEASRQADSVVTTLEAELSRLRNDVKARAALLVQKDAQQKTFAITAELAADLKGDRFQEFLLEEAFKTLVAGASVRLKGISNRYTLQWESGEFYVVDHDNAGERRRAETLSGGETFMASLCLALQLSDEVLRTSGALQMDSLFIDEGFGTLDSDSLSEVTDAMEALRQDGGRVIGVISHRPELTERLPGCIRVNKGIGESSWIVERVG
jgi:DNA repair protein SbcC/Rad50